MERILYVTDLDGTLFNTKDQISEESMRIINELVEQGMMFTYATARSLVSASVVTKGLSTNIPIIAYNGTFIFHAATGEVLSQEKFSKEEIRNVIEVLEQYDISPLVYAYVDGTEKVTWNIERENYGVRRYLGNRIGDKRFRPIANTHELYQGDIFYFTCIGEKEELESAYNILAKDTRYRCMIQRELYRTEYWFEIMPAGATKANAIKKLKKLWNCDKVISFGDAMNDIPMFEISDEAYAVENAVAELKNLATDVIGSNEEDGVARWLKEHVIFE